MSNIQAINTEVVVGGFTQAELDTIKSTIAKGTTNEQFNLFIRTAAASGLNPFLNHIYCIVYGQGNNATMSIQVSVEGILFLAKRVEGYQGIDTQLVHENDEFEAHIEDGKWVISKHKIKFPRGKVIAGYSVAYREGFNPYTVFMDFEEVQHNLAGSNASLWKKYTNDMFKKHLSKRSAKGQFGIEISEDEVQVGPTEPTPYVRKDVTPATELIDSPKEDLKEDPKEEPEDEATKLKKARAEMKKKFEILGITDKEEMGEYISKNANPKGDKPTLSELLGLLKIMDLEIEAKQADDDLLG